MNDFKSVSSILLVSLLGYASPTFSDGAISLLNRMNQALHGLSYKGTLVYAKGGDPFTTLQITHNVVNGKETETVVQPSGAGSKASRGFKGFSLVAIPKISPATKRFYSFDMGRTKRVANLPCVVVTARPKDRVRYLQKYCINTNTGMLLDYSMIDKSHKPVEQFMFSRIQISASDNTALKVSTVKLAKSNQLKQLSNLDDGWVINTLPRGFGVRRAPNKYSNVKNVKTVTKHYVLSDGLSSLSVFISPFTKAIPASNVRINSGALNVLTKRKHNSYITVVGEVPEVTLKKVMNNIRKK